MLSSIKGLMTTISEFFRPIVTAQYPEKHLPIADRYMGFPVLMYDDVVDEPYCTGCMVCVRNCPTNCMSAIMKDNPKNESGESKRRKIIDAFEIKLGRCILCGICVEVCNFDAIEMSHQHELSVVNRNGNRANLQQLLEMGKSYQKETNWAPPVKPAKESKE